MKISLLKSIFVFSALPVLCFSEVCGLAGSFKGRSAPEFASHLFCAFSPDSDHHQTDHHHPDKATQLMWHCGVILGFSFSHPPRAPSISNSGASIFKIFQTLPTSSSPGGYSWAPPETSLSGAICLVCVYPSYPYLFFPQAQGLNSPQHT